MSTFTAKQPSALIGLRARVATRLVGINADLLSEIPSKPALGARVSSPRDGVA
jgi:hypothetical protein